MNIFCLDGLGLRRNDVYYSDGIFTVSVVQNVKVVAFLNAVGRCRISSFALDENVCNM